MLYAVYLAYHKSEVLDERMAGYDDLPDYPAAIARVRVYDNKAAQWDSMANTMCPASQCLEAETEAELDRKIKQMQSDFIDEAWLDEHIRPFI